VQAYTVLARMGEFKPLRMFDGQLPPGRRVFSDDVTSVIADILSDPHARELEFGRYSILNFAAPTAVKTGTSSDYRDAWALGYDDRYTVGVWMGNLDYTAMHDVTGSTGPALVLRAALRELNRHRERGPLFRSPNLVQRTVCRATGLPPAAPCATRDEWFVRGVVPRALPHANTPVRLRKPINGLRLAMDPRIPDEHEFFRFELAGADDARRVRWFVNGEAAATTSGNTYAWRLAPGTFTAFAEIDRTDGETPARTATVTFEVQ
jgi:penicillin-binding protein 1C